MSNLPTVTDKTTLNPSPPNEPPPVPVSPSSGLYLRLGRDLFEPYEALTKTFRTLALHYKTETASTGSSSSVDSAKQSISTNSGLDQQVKNLFDTILIKESRIRELEDELETLNDPSIHEPSVTSPRRRLTFNNTTIISPTRQNSPLRIQSPLRARSPLRMPGSTDGTNNAAQAQAPDLATPLVQKLGELFSREEKKTIPTYKGKTSDKPVTDWLKTAERVAQNNNWDPTQKIRFFSDRLGGEAIDWHTTYVITQGANLRYDEWKKDFIERFRNESDIEKLKNKLHILKQKPEQRTRAFVAKLNDLYDSIHGKERAAPAETANLETVALYHDILKFRNVAKKKILMKGLLPTIKTELWPRISATDTFEILCEVAYIAESIVIKKFIKQITYTLKKSSSVKSSFFCWQKYCLIASATAVSWHNFNTFYYLKSERRKTIIGD